MVLHGSNSRGQNRSSRLAAGRRWVFFGGFCMELLAFATLKVSGQQPDSAPAPSPDNAVAITPAQAPSTELKKMSLEDLMKIEVTTVSRRESTVWDSAAAIAVITQDDIHRSGVTSIPEALRMVPGLEVAQINSSSWSVSARGNSGFTSGTANKLLVLIDGRSVYSPLFAGVFWDVQDTMMEDIDRIEVIRGPAGALWGANAVNGVINVITKSAKDTQGLLFSGGGGTQERDFCQFCVLWLETGQ